MFQKGRLKKLEHYSDNVIGTKCISEPYNCCIRRYPSHNEIIIYNDVNFKRRSGFESQDPVVRTPRFQYDSDRDLLVPARGCCSVNDLLKTLERSHNRAIDSVYDYALSNEWDYFITFTFVPDEEKYDRFNLHSLVKVWGNFRSKMFYYDPSSKFLVVPEKHPTSGAYHFHALCKGNFDRFLIKAFNPHNGDPIKTFLGQDVYNLDKWDYGFTTVAKLDSDRIRVANYLAKYFVKSTVKIDGKYCHKKVSSLEVSYKQRMYYSSHGLRRCSRDYYLLSASDLSSVVSEYKCIGDQFSMDKEGISVLKKTTNSFIIYNQFPINYSQNTTFAK